MFNNFLLDEYLYNEPYLRNFFANNYDLFVDYKDVADAEGDPPFGDAAYLFLRYMLNTEIEKEFFDYYMFGLANNTIPPGEVHIIKNAFDQIISEIIPNATIDAGKVLWNGVLTDYKLERIGPNGNWNLVLGTFTIYLDSNGNVIGMHDLYDFNPASGQNLLGTIFGSTHRSLKGEWGTRITSFFSLFAFFNPAKYNPTPFTIDFP